MKAFWKILGLGALVVGLTPYKVEKNEETGENSYQALLWRISSTPGEGENKRAIDINLGEGTLTSKLMNSTEKKEEPHLFSDELSVEYDAPSTEATDEEVEAVTEQAAGEPEAEPEEPAEPAEPAEPEEPAEVTEEAEKEEPKEEE